MRSYVMGLHTMSTEKPLVTSSGTPAFERSSSTTSSLMLKRTIVPVHSHSGRTPSDARRTRSSSPIARRASASALGYWKLTSRRLLSPMSQRTLTPSTVCASFVCRSVSASSFTIGPKAFWYWNASSYTSGSGWTSSSAPDVSRSSTVALGFDFHSSSSLASCCVASRRLRSVSSSLGSCARRAPRERVHARAGGRAGRGRRG